MWCLISVDVFVRFRCVQDHRGGIKTLQLMETTDCINIYSKHVLRFLPHWLFTADSLWLVVCQWINQTADDSIITSLNASSQTLMTEEQEERNQTVLETEQNIQFIANMLIQ